MVFTVIHTASSFIVWIALEVITSNATAEAIDLVNYSAKRLDENIGV